MSTKKFFVEHENISVKVRGYKGNDYEIVGNNIVKAPMDESFKLVFHSYNEEAIVTVYMSGNTEKLSYVGYFFIPRVSNLLSFFLIRIGSRDHLRVW